MLRTYSSHHVWAGVRFMMEINPKKKNSIPDLELANQLNMLY